MNTIGGYMVKLLIAGASIFMTSFLYCSLVVAKRSDEMEYKEEEKLNWKK